MALQRQLLLVQTTQTHTALQRQHYLYTWERLSSPSFVARLVIPANGMAGCLNRHVAPVEGRTPLVHMWLLKRL